MPLDKYGRWYPDNDINWSKSTTESDLNYRGRITSELNKSGVEWADGGYHAFNVGLGKSGGENSTWTNLSEEQRWEVLQLYDQWYDVQDQETKDNDTWGMDLDRGITYNEKDNWDAHQTFADLMGLQQGKNEASVLDDIVGGKEIDYNSYNSSGMYRGVVDDVMEKHENLFGNPLFENVHNDIDNTTEIRAINNVVREWQLEKGLNSDEFHTHLASQVKEGALRNTPDSDRENWERNRDARIDNWDNPWYTFDPATGTAQHKDILTGEVLDEYKYETPALPQPMQLTNDADAEDKQAGIYFSSTMGDEQRITDSLSPRPSEPNPPAQLNLKIKPYVPRDRSADYLKIENHPYLGKPEPRNSSVNSVKVEVMKYG